MTDDQIRDYVTDSLSAGSLQDLPSGNNLWNANDNTPGATWSPATGSDDLTEQGTVEIVTYNYMKP